MMKRKFLMPIMALAVSLFCVNCSSSDDDDEWSMNGWESSRYEVCNRNGMEYIKVPAEGGRYAFRCKDAKSVVFSEYYYGSNYSSYNEPSDSELSHYSNDRYSATIKGDSVIVEINPVYRDYAFIINVGVKVDGEYQCFRFLQQNEDAKTSTEFAGEWVLDSSYYDGNEDIENYQLSVRKDGIYVFNCIDYSTNNKESRCYEDIQGWSDSEFGIKFHMRYYSCTPKIENNKLILTSDNGGQLTFVRMNEYEGSFLPIYDLYVVPTKSSYSYFPSSDYLYDIRLFEGEKYTLRCDLFANGKDYTINSFNLSCKTEFSLINCESKKIDINKGKNFSADFVVPEGARKLRYELSYKGTYKTKDEKGNMVEVPFSNNKYLYIEVKRK